MGCSYLNVGVGDLDKILYHSIFNVIIDLENQKSMRKLCICWGLF